MPPPALGKTEAGTGCIWDFLLHRSVSNLGKCASLRTKGRRCFLVGLSHGRLGLVSGRPYSSSWCSMPPEQPEYIATMDGKQAAAPPAAATTRAPWAPHPAEVNVPHAFVPHKDVMSPTGAPWAAPQAGPAAVLGNKAPQEVIQASPRFPEPTTSRSFTPARKQIATAADLKAFLEGQSARDLVSFILSCSEACQGKKLSQLAASPSPIVERLSGMLGTMSAWVDDIPPMEQSLRYGNPAFRTWHARLVEQAPSLLQAVLPQELQAAVPELSPYLVDSFGNATRIDYGTGQPSPC